MYLTSKIQQTQHRHEVDLSILRNLSYHAARLYNVGLYTVRQHYFNTQSYLSYYSNYNLCKTNEHYQILLTDASQQILRLVDRDMQSFFKLLTLKKSGKYSEKVKLPHYKPMDGLMTFAIQGRSCRIQKDGKVAIGLTKEFREKYNISERRILFTIPKHLRHVSEFKEIRIIPQYGGKQFSVEFIYESGNNNKQAQGDGYMSIDLGVDNLAACVVFSNGNNHQFLIDGKTLKNINYYYNKKIAGLKSEYAKHKDMESDNTPRMRRLMNGRINRINDYFNKSVKIIIDKCIENNVTTLVIGYNKEQKQSINIGKVNNQNTVMIPLYRFRQKLQYQCELHGIKYCPQEESYTSKANSLNCDEIPVYGDSIIPVFTGKRIKRGLYESNDGVVINADINGSVNILRKYISTCKSKAVTADDVRAVVNTPCPRVNPWLKPTNL